MSFEIILCHFSLKYLQTIQVPANRSESIKSFSLTTCIIDL